MNIYVYLAGWGWLVGGEGCNDIYMISEFQQNMNFSLDYSQEGKEYIGIKHRISIL